MSLCVVHWLRASIKLWFISHSCRYCCFSTNFDTRKTCWTFGIFFLSLENHLQQKRYSQLFFRFFDGWVAFGMLSHFKFTSREMKEIHFRHTVAIVHIFTLVEATIFVFRLQICTHYSLTFNLPWTRRFQLAYTQLDVHSVNGLSLAFHICTVTVFALIQIIYLTRTKQNKTHKIVWWNSHGE